MAVVRNLMVRAGADFSGLYKEMKNANNRMNSFGNTFKKAFKGAVIATAAATAGNYIKDSVQQAMSVEGAIGSINRTMGTSALNFMNWAQTSASAFGMSQKDAMEFGRTYSNLVSGFTTDTAQTTDYTKNLLKTAAVVSSNMGMSMSEVMDRIRSGLLGNTEAIEDLGINVNVAMIESTNAFRQFAGDKSWNQLDFQMQQKIRYFAIMEQAGQKFGTELANNTSTKMLVFTAQLQNVKLSLGEAFLPILETVLPLLTAFANKLAKVTKWVSDFMKGLFGDSKVKATAKQTKAVKKQSDAYKELGNDLKNTATQSRQSLANLDQINTLAKDSGSGYGISLKPTVTIDDQNVINDGTTKVKQVVKEIEKRSQAETIGAKVKAAFTYSADEQAEDSKRAQVAADYQKKFRDQLQKTPFNVSVDPKVNLNNGKSTESAFMQGVENVFNTSVGWWKSYWDKSQIDTSKSKSGTPFNTTVDTDIKFSTSKENTFTKLGDLYSSIKTWWTDFWNGNKKLGISEKRFSNIVDAELELKSDKKTFLDTLGDLWSKLKKWWTDFWSGKSLSTSFLSGTPANVTGGKSKDNNSYPMNMYVPPTATGGIVNSPQVRLVGEAGAEAIMPLENNTQWIDKLASKLGGNGGGDIVIQIGGTQLARITASEMNRINRQAGKTIINV